MSRARNRLQTITRQKQQANKRTKKEARRQLKEEHILAAMAAAEASHFEVAQDILTRANVDRCAVCCEARSTMRMRFEGVVIGLCLRCLRIRFTRELLWNGPTYVLNSR